MLAALAGQSGRAAGFGAEAAHARDKHSTVQAPAAMVIATVRPRVEDRSLDINMVILRLLTLATKGIDLTGRFHSPHHSLQGDFLNLAKR
jgi:hypothetical protein